jgi:predicted helicase
MTRPFAAWLGSVRTYQHSQSASSECTNIPIRYDTSESLKHPLRFDQFDQELYRVQKMIFGRNKDRGRILTTGTSHLPAFPRAYVYTLGARSAIEWIVDRCQVTTHKESGITNDPNDWSDDLRYIVDLVKLLATVGDHHYVDPSFRPCGQWLRSQCRHVAL